MPNFELIEILDMPELPKDIRRLEKALRLCLPEAESSLHEPLARVVHARSKRLRPALLLAIVAASGRPVDKAAISAAAAVELLHIGSLVHDDSIDQADSRWNQPTINHQEGDSVAIIGGDYLFAQAAGQAALADQPTPFGIASLMAKTLGQLCEGQSLELAALHDTGRTQAAYLQAIHGKTAALFQTACGIGGRLAGLPSRQVRALEVYGEALGMAFQLLDDVLDYISAEELSGKTIGTDVRQGVYTLPLILALQKAQNDRLHQLVLQESSSVVEIAELLMKYDSLNQTLIMVREYCLTAETALQIFKEPGFSGLGRLPLQYAQWAINNLVAEPYIAAAPVVFANGFSTSRSA